MFLSHESLRDLDRWIHKQPGCSRVQFRSWCVRVPCRWQLRYLSSMQCGCLLCAAIVNLALAKSAWQSSVDAGGVPSRAVDGDKNSRWPAHSCTHTSNHESNPWWMVDLGTDAHIDHVEVTNRADCCGNFNYYVICLLLCLLPLGRKMTNIRPNGARCVLNFPAPGNVFAASWRYSSPKRKHSGNPSLPINTEISIIDNLTIWRCFEHWQQFFVTWAYR